LIGAYQKGSDPRVDFAINKIDEVNKFLQQGLYEKMTFDQCVEALCKLFEDQQ
jgi:flagellum-specific ATP synthase